MTDHHPDAFELLRQARPKHIRPDEYTDITTSPAAARILTQILGHSATNTLTPAPPAASDPLETDIEIVVRHVHREPTITRRRLVVLTSLAAAVIAVVAFGAVLAAQRTPTPSAPAAAPTDLATTPATNTTPATSAPLTPCTARTEPDGPTIITVPGPVTFTGTSPPGAVITLETPLGQQQVTADSDGSWTATVTLDGVPGAPDYAVIITCQPPAGQQPTTNTIYTYQGPPVAAGSESTLVVQPTATTSTVA